MPIEHIFLDDGGVINDNARRAPQWRRLVGEFFPSRLGGSAAQWSEANAAAIPAVLERFSARLAAWHVLDLGADAYRRVIDLHNIDWLRSMCEVVGVAAPSADVACLSLAEEAVGFVMPRVRADFPGAIEAVRWLSERYQLRTASNGASFELQQMYEPLGIETCFLALYGPDLVGEPKTSRRFYDRVFKHAGVVPATALVLDDHPSCIGWAREAGAQAILVGASAEVEAAASIAALSDLPALLAKRP